jgi:hypothetical protein
MVGVLREPVIPGPVQLYVTGERAAEAVKIMLGEAHVMEPCGLAVIVVVNAVDRG